MPSRPRDRVTAIPPFARGYRDGSRDLVTTIHAAANRCAYYGARASLNSEAHGIGVTAARLHEQLSGRPGRHHAIASRSQYTIDPARLRLSRSEEDEARLQADAARLATGPPLANRHPDPIAYVRGYLEAIEDGVTWVCAYGLALNDPQARHEYEERAAELQEATERLRRSDRFTHLHRIDASSRQAR